MNKQKRKNKNVVFRKPSFNKILIKNLAICVSMAILIGYIGTLWAFSYCDELAYSMYGETLAEYKEVILLEYMDIFGREEITNLLTGEVMSEEEKWEQLAVRAKVATIDTYYEECWGITNIATNEFVMKSAKNVLYYWIETDESPEKTYFLCENEAILSEINKYTGDDFGEVIEFGDFYVKGFELIPGKVTILRNTGVDKEYYYDAEGNEVSADEEWTESVITPYETLAELDFTPENTYGYTHIDTDKINYSSHLMGGSSFLFTSAEDTRWILEKGVEEKGPRHLYVGEMIVEESGWADCEKKRCFFDEMLFETNARGFAEVEYQLVVAGEDNLFLDYKRDYIIAYGILLLLAIVTPCVMSYIQYTRQKSYYEMDQYRRNMTNTMAHDLKSPLMVISGFAENLLETELQAQQRHYTDSILGNVQYMNRIIENILDLSKVEHTEYKLQKEEIDLCELTESLTINYKTQMEEKGLEVQVSGTCNINADKQWMTQVLDNLLSNAVKYAVGGTVVEVNMSETCFEISNIASIDFDMDVNELVNPFVKGDNSRSGKMGSGIGLTIVKNIVEQHGYQLELECVDGQFVVRIVMG